MVATGWLVCCGPRKGASGLADRLLFEGSRDEDGARDCGCDCANSTSGSWPKWMLRTHVGARYSPPDVDADADAGVDVGPPPPPPPPSPSMAAR